MNNFESKLLLICKEYEHEPYMPDDLHEKYELFLQAEHNKYVTKLITSISLSLGLYHIASLFYISGLISIVANDGLANLDEGALLTSGYGIICGIAVAMTVGYTLARLFGRKSENQLFTEFMESQPSIFQDSINNDDYEIVADFKFEDGKFTFFKNIRLYENDNMLFEGRISRNNGELVFKKILSVRIKDYRNVV